MRIQKIDMHTVRIPLVTLEDGGISPYVGSRDFQAGTQNGTTYALSNVFKVETDDGLTGWGEANPVISLAVSRQMLDEFIRPMLIGRDPFRLREITALFSGIYNPQLYLRTFLPGIEMACWDLKGKAAGRSVCDLLGGPVRTEMPVAYCLGMLAVDTLREKVRQVCEAGFQCIKLKGGLSVADDIQRTKAAREAGGGRLRLRLDANQSYDVPSALHYLHAVEDCSLEYVEQPLPIRHAADLAVLRTRTCVPLAINEDCYIPGGLLEHIRAGAVDAAVVDLEALGGIGPLAKLGIMAGEAGLPLAHHCGFDMGIKTAAILQTVCACESFSYATDSTYHAHADDLLAARLPLQNGAYRLPDAPGLGIEVDEEKVRFYSIERCERRFF